MRYSSNSVLKAILICIGFTAINFLIAANSTLWDRDEPRYARVTVEMTGSGNYLVPTFNDEAWADKPPLLYWLMSIPVHIFGPTEVACRFFGVIGTAITLLLTFFIGKKLFDDKAGLWAEAILATTLLMLFVGTSAIVDGVLLPLIVGAMAVFTARAGKEIRVFDYIVIGILMGIGMLAKGPVGLLPVMVLIAVFWFSRKNRGNFIVHLGFSALSIIIALGIFLIWAIPANKAANGEILRVFVGHHIFDRLMKPMESHGGGILLYLPYYPAVIIAGFFPWTIFLPGALSLIIAKRIGVPGTRNILISWAAVPVILMTFAATKLPHYILFAWPAMAVMVGGSLASEKDVFCERDRKWLRGGIWFFIPIGLGLASGLIAAGYFLKIEELKFPGLICGLIIIIMTIICCKLQLEERFKNSATGTLSGIIILLLPILFGLLPAIESSKISPSLAKGVKEKTNYNISVAAYKYDEPTLNFYIGRKITRLRNENEVIEWLKGADRQVLIIPKKVFDEIMKKSYDIKFEQIASKKGINYSKGTEIIEVIAVVNKNLQ